MARIALIDPTGRAATTVRAVLGSAHEIVVRQRIHAPGDVDLVLADLRYADLVDPATLRALASFAPLLVLVDRREPVPPSVEETPSLAILRKPFEAFELRLKVEHLLRASLSPMTMPHSLAAEEDDASWLEFPYVPAPAGAVLRRAAKLAAPLWILGEPGCGRRRIALAVCRSARPPLRAVTLHPDERLEPVLAQERERGRGPFALIVPEIEERPILEQERLASILSGQRGFRLIATSVEDPAERVLAGAFSRNLYRHLIGLAVQISPLRERPIAIPPLAQALARRLARSLGSHGELSFSPDAMARLQTYMWPGNVVELESVLIRTLTSIPESDLDGRMIEADELLFTPEDAVRPRGARRAENRTPSTVAARRADTKDAAEETTAPVPVAAAADSFETLVASLAHDLRNPMTAIKTFAATVTRGELAPADAELGALVAQACDRLDDYLTALQRYGAFGAPGREPVDLAEIVRNVIADLGEDSGRITHELGGVAIAARGDREQLHFVVENLLAAALAEAGDGGVVTVAFEAPRALVMRVPAARGAVAKLRTVVSEPKQPASWRIVLARAIAARNGCEVDVEATAEAMAIRCRVSGSEVEARGKQTNRIDRR